MTGSWGFIAMLQQICCEHAQEKKDKPTKQQITTQTQQFQSKIKIQTNIKTVQLIAEVN